MVLRGFERRLERMVEGAFARAFKSGLRPVELGRRLVREIDDGRNVDVRGNTVVPNQFSVVLSERDLTEFAEVHDTMVRELADVAREHARDEGYTFMGPVAVELVSDESMHTGAFRIDARLKEGEGGTGAGSMILPGGERVALAHDPIVVGRLPECGIVLNDSNVSRRHAEIRPHGTGWAVADLGSTNGTRVNGIRTNEQVLDDGDEITFGNIRVTFQAS